MKLYTGAGISRVIAVICSLRVMLRDSPVLAKAAVLCGLSLLLAAECDAQKTFATPDDAANALLAAAEAADLPALYSLFGPAGAVIVTSGDPAQDKNLRDAFVAKAKALMRVQKDREDQNKAVILIGTDETPYAIPLKARNGEWQFDLVEGKREIRARRIGANELEAIETCAAYVTAQREYAAEKHGDEGVREYAKKLISSPGKQDGLYRPVSSGGSSSPLSELLSQAAADSSTADGGGAVASRGYYFKILTRQGSRARGGVQDYIVHGLMIGGFALIAWPAEYGVSGVKTFLVNQEAVIFEKDLGRTTAATAPAITMFNPDTTWRALH